MSNLFGRIVIIAFAVVGLFTAGLLGTMGARGQLSRESLAEYFTEDAEAAKEHAGDAEPSADHAATTGGEEHPTAEHAEKAGVVLTPRGMPRVELPSPFSTEQSAELFEELEATRTELKNRLAAAKQQEKDLGLVRSDLNRRWDELDRREQELEEQAKGIVAERSEIAGRTVLLHEAEQENLSNFAKKIEKMKAQAAAELLQQQEPAEAAKILSFVRDREAGKIMENLPPEFLSQIAEKAIGILRPTMSKVAGSSDDKAGK